MSEGGETDDEDNWFCCLVMVLIRPFCFLFRILGLTKYTLEALQGILGTVLHEIVVNKHS